MVSNLRVANQTAAHQTRLKHGDEFLPDTQLQVSYSANRPSKAPRSVTSSTFSKRSSGSSTNKGHFTPAFKALINAENLSNPNYPDLINPVYAQKEVDSNYAVRTYRLYSVIVGGHHNPRSNIVTIKPAVILHSRGYSCKKKRREMSSLGTNTILTEYPETRMAILAFLVSNFHLVGCNTNVSYITEGASHFCESRTINLFLKYIAIKTV
ncbi:hypothetical protein ALC53_11462 [Atta colombica]|uniref:Uncharacterized protein n=1 Tax=Atta colombica TaxID=520822 RepID=A0A195B127_9HYME|nr:hypothetical protein ALC53_11462 [Atta colombica]